MQKLFIDTDCGVDDATAIMLALASEDADVVGISCVAGNTSLDNVIHNVLGLLYVTENRNIPVFRGASQGLVEKRINAEEVHGGNGLAGIDLPGGSLSEDSRLAPQGIYETAKSNPGLTLVTLGPLTNIAIALNLYPDLPQYIGRIVMMGGGIETGNVTKFAEFNYFADPEAVQVVLDSSISLEVAPWDLTLATLTDQEDIDDLEMQDSPMGPFFLKLQAFVMNFYESAHGARRTGHPDPLTMAFVLKPEHATRVITAGLKMELDRNAMRGMSVLLGAGSIKIVMGYDKKEFLNLLLSLKTLKYSVT